MLLLGLILGSLLETIYRSVYAKTFTRPKLVNVQMYGLVGGFLAVLYTWHLALALELLLLLMVPTMIEFITGYLYHRFTGKYPWDYSLEKRQIMKLVSLRFSLIWFTISLVAYYLLIPLITTFQHS